MKFANRTAAYAFLDELEVEIERVNNRSFTASKNVPYIIEPESVDEYLPRQIVRYDAPNLKTAKLEILVAVLNAVTIVLNEQKDNNQPIAIETIRQKMEIDHRTFAISEDKALSAAEVLAMHRRESESSFWNSIGKGWLFKIISFLVNPQPKSYTFLEKNGFFAKAEPIQPEEPPSLQPETTTLS